MISPEILRKFEELCRRVSSNRGGVIFFSGESGIGKTFTARQLVSEAETRGFVRLTGKCRPQSEDPLYPIYEALAHCLRQGSLSHQQLRELLAEYSPMLPRISSLIRPLIQNDSYLRGLEMLNVSPRSSTPIYPVCLDFINRLACGRPTLFWLDDLQWVDRETLSFLMYTASQAHAFPIIWIICFNPRRRGLLAKDVIYQGVHYIQHEITDDSGFFVELSRYGHDQFLALMTNMLGLPVKLPERILKELYSRTQGVPYILKTFVDMLRREGSLLESEGSFTLNDNIEMGTLPESLQSVIASRIENAYRNFPEARNILEAAAVLGERFDDSDLDSLFGMCDAYRLLTLIEDNNSLVRSIFEEGLWEFEHITVRDFVYQALGRRASKIHKKIASHLISTNSDEYSRIAYHCKQAGDLLSSIEYQIRQAESYLSQGFFLDANQLFSDLWRNPLLTDNSYYLTRQFEVHYARALCHFHLSEFDTCLHRLDELTQLFDKNADPSVVLLRAKCLNKGSSRTGFYAAKDLLEGALARFEIKASPYFSGRMAAELVVSYAHLNDFVMSRKSFVLAEKLLNPYESPIELAQLMRRAIMFYEPELAEKLLLRAIEIFKRHHVDHEVVRTTNNLATLCMSVRQFDRAKLYLQQALTLNSRLGNFADDYLINNLALVRLAEGFPEAALEALRNAETCARRVVCKLIIRVNQAAVLLKMEQHETAAELLSSLLPIAFEVGEDYYLLTIRLDLAISFLMVNNIQATLRQLTLCPYKRVESLGRYYTERYRTVLIESLARLGALRNKPDGLLSNVEPAFIDMQFWGD